MELLCVGLIVAGCLWAAAKMFGLPGHRPPSAVHDPRGYQEHYQQQAGFQAAGCFYLFFGLVFLVVLLSAVLGKK